MLECPIFKFSPNFSGNSSESNGYNDVIFHTGSRRTCEWENSIAFKYIDDQPTTITNSNHFLVWDHFDPFHNTMYKIFDNLFNNYNDLIQSKPLDYSLDSDDCYYWLLSSFTFSNSGHNLSECLDALFYINQNSYKKVLILKGFKESNNFKLMELFAPNVEFIEVDLNSLYFVKNVFIKEPLSANITSHQNIIDELKNKVIDKYSLQYDHLKNKKVILMKTNRNKNVIQPLTQINCEELLVELENRGFINIIPEEFNIFELAIYLLFANTIVYSTGSVLYTNKMFFNLNANLIFMNVCCLGEMGCSDHAIINLSKRIDFGSRDLNCAEILPKILDFITHSNI